ncbi:TMEM175 family protein [Streptomyces sp. NPDC010273]|uniref:TMEM175 family protein n=1 Tax=Streptomyces sp. NPDC010273 TaxID=3364829 RepID=UPI0036F1345B
MAATRTSAHTPGTARLIALSDGIYAIAMTLLVINVAVPADLSDAAFHKALSGTLPSLVALLPFPTSLLAEYASKPDAVALYASAMAAIHAVHAALLLLTQRQVHPSPDSPAAKARLRFTVQLAPSVLVFVLSIPLAYVDSAAAMWFWITVVPAHVALGRYHRRQAWAQD